MSAVLAAEGAVVAGKQTWKAAWATLRFLLICALVGFAVFVAYQIYTTEKEETARTIALEVDKQTSAIRVGGLLLTVQSMSRRAAEKDVEIEQARAAVTALNGQFGAIRNDQRVLQDQVRSTLSELEDKSAPEVEKSANDTMADLNRQFEETYP